MQQLSSYLTPKLTYLPGYFGSKARLGTVFTSVQCRLKDTVMYIGSNVTSLRAGVPL